MERVEVLTESQSSSSSSEKYVEGAVEGVVLVERETNVEGAVEEVVLVERENTVEGFLRGTRLILATRPSSPVNPCLELPYTLCKVNLDMSEGRIGSPSL